MHVWEALIVWIVCHRMGMGRPPLRYRPNHVKSADFHGEAFVLIQGKRSHMCYLFTGRASRS
jgi:hypothetical protein